MLIMHKYNKNKPLLFYSHHVTTVSELSKHCCLFELHIQIDIG